MCLHMYRKQKILRGTKLLRFSWIFDKTQKFSLLISMARSNMYCNLTKLWQFSLHSAKKPVNRDSSVPRRICYLRCVLCLIYMDEKFQLIRARLIGTIARPEGIMLQNVFIILFRISTKLTSTLAADKIPHQHGHYWMHVGISVFFSNVSIYLATMLNILLITN